MYQSPHPPRALLAQSLSRKHTQQTIRLKLGERLGGQPSASCVARVKPLPVPLLLRQRVKTFINKTLSATLLKNFNRCAKSLLKKL